MYRPYTKVVDWWSFGVLLYEMLAGMPPFEGGDEEELFLAVTEGSVYYSKSLSKEAVALCKGLLTKAPNARLGCSEEREIKDHLFYRNINWQKLQDREIQPPFKPKVKSPRDVGNFDHQFTCESLHQSPTDKLFLMNLDQNVFGGFSYINPEFVMNV